MSVAPTPTDTHERLTAEIHGHVQGVGFRYFTRQAARRHGLVGWVRNDPEGTVTVQAEGARPRLDAFLDALREGPDAAEVEEVEARWELATGRFKSFSVEYY
ncbi:MAG: acylphosphatase [Rubricoccaceae bacterium]|nr:acylphosphatase [Rubricoccaceae bacterium]